MKVAKDSVCKQISYRKQCWWTGLFPSLQVCKVSRRVSQPQHTWQLELNVSLIGNGETIYTTHWQHPGLYPQMIPASDPQLGTTTKYLLALPNGL